MTALRPALEPEDHRQVNSHPWRRPVLLAAALLGTAVALLFAQPALSAANAADDSQAPVSESPSDVRSPTPPPSAAEVPNATCARQRKVVRCRREGLFRRLLRGCRPQRCCCRGAGVPREQDAAETADEPPKPDPYAWKNLFDGKTLEGWKSPNFGGEGKVYVKDGMLVMEMGESMTGATWTGEVPRDNYELEYEGIRLEGVDFFATVTFPVGKDHASLVTGGWGGSVVGISCIDFYDASDNLTTTFQDFKDKQWYKFRVRVTPAKIEAWVGDGQVVDQQREGHKIDIRLECDLCRPLGFATYTTTGAVRNIRIRKLRPAAAAEESPKQE